RVRSPSMRGHRLPGAPRQTKAGCMQSRGETGRPPLRSPPMSFRDLTPGDVTTGTENAIAEARAVLDELCAPKEQPTFENTMRPIDRINDILGHAFYRYAFMGYVHTSKEVRDAAKEAEEKLS